MTFRQKECGISLVPLYNFKIASLLQYNATLNSNDFDAMFKVLFISVLNSKMESLSIKLGELYRKMKLLCVKLDPKDKDLAINTINYFIKRFKTRFRQFVSHKSMIEKEFKLIFGGTGNNFQMDSVLDKFELSREYKLKEDSITKTKVTFTNESNHYFLNRVNLFYQNEQDASLVNSFSRLAIEEVVEQTPYDEHKAPKKEFDENSENLFHLIRKILPELELKNARHRSRARFFKGDA